MTLYVPMALFGWVPLVLVAFALLPARKAIAASFVVGWLFLPVAGFQISGFVDYTKTTATCVAALLGVLLFHSGRLLAFRPTLLDLPMAVWCFCPLFTSMANELGIYDGAAGVISHVLTWGIPYILGRLYFADWAGLRLLALAIFLGGLLYVPFCLWEIRMSPQLHSSLYGFSQLKFQHTVRLGGYRPTVFLTKGMELGMWMALASIAGVWLWRSGAVKRVLGFAMWGPLMVLLGTTVLCRSLGALALLAAGLCIALIPDGRLVRIAVLGLLLASPAYFVARTALGWTGEPVNEWATRFDASRGRSLQTRLDSEDVLVEHAMQRPVLGWGGWGRQRVVDESGDREEKSDGLWVGILSKFGFLGLTALWTTLLLPLALLVRRSRSWYWVSPGFGAAAGLSVGLALVVLDAVMNAFVNPVHLLMVGALSGLAIGLKPVAQRALGTVHAVPATP